MFIFPHLSLDHEVPFFSHLEYKIERVYHLSLSGSLQLYVNGDKASRAPNTSTTVDQEGFFIAIGVGVADPSQEVEQGGGVTGNTKIRPGDEMELTNLSHLFRLHLK